MRMVNWYLQDQVLRIEAIEQLGSATLLSNSFNWKAKKVIKIFKITILQILQSLRKKVTFTSPNKKTIRYHHIITLQCIWITTIHSKNLQTKLCTPSKSTIVLLIIFKTINLKVKIFLVSAIKSLVKLINNHHLSFPYWN